MKWLNRLLKAVELDNHADDLQRMLEMLSAHGFHQVLAVTMVGTQRFMYEQKETGTRVWLEADEADGIEFDCSGFSGKTVEDLQRFLLIHSVEK